MRTVGTMTTTEHARIDWTGQLLEQITWHWNHQARARLDGLSDDEYFWEPVDGCWSVRPRGESTAEVRAGTGTHVIEFAYPPPEPEPVTTIAWRLGHLLVGIYGDRQARHFGGAPVDYRSYDYPTTAADALDRLDSAHTAWITGVSTLDEHGLARPCGEPDFEQLPMAALILHINRELIHHLAEVALLRDLYLRVGNTRLTTPTSR